MGVRGKKSGAELISKAQIVSIDGRLAPPHHLPDSQREVWTDIVNSLPAEWFTRKDYPLFMQLVTHIENAGNIQAALSKFPVDKIGDMEYLKTYEKLTAAHERETRAITALYRTFRITQQSEIRADKVRTINDTGKPWETD